MSNLKASPEVMRSQAERVRSQGKVLQTKMHDAYRKVSGMANTAWYGKRYDELATAYNAAQVTDVLKKMLDVVIFTVPSNLETMANNYATSFGTGRKGNVGTEKATNFPTITLTNRGEEVYIDPSKVTTVKDDVARDFTAAVNEMNGSISQAIDSMLTTWEGKAKDQFAKDWRQIKENVVKTVNDLNKTFKDQLELAIADAPKVENANMGL